MVTMHSSAAWSLLATSSQIYSENWRQKAEWKDLEVCNLLENEHV